jgi:hypothetical protein
VGNTDDVKHFFEKAVLLTGESQFLKTQNGRWAFIDSALLLVRITKRLTVEVKENEELAREIAILLTDRTKHKATVTTMGVDYRQFEAILSVGSKVMPSLPWTTINSNGWVARVSSIKTDLAANCVQENPIGALTAACLGVTEVFKRLVKPRPERGELHDAFEFSFYSYSAGDIPGPEISKCDVGNLVLIGGGAIGNGVCQLLRQLPIDGHISIVDFQEFREENLGTCLLVSTGDIGKQKAEVLAKAFNANLHAKAYPENVSTFVKQRLGDEVPYPRIILTGVDNIDARREVQAIWPDLIIDGAIGALSCEATLHPWGPDLSCLMCDFELPAISAAKAQSNLTGLHEDRLASLLDVVTDEDVRNAPRAKKEFLAKHVGKQICAVLPEAEIERLSELSQEKGFEPSVPFVACLSSCMMVTELLRSLMRHEQMVDTGYQFDVLIGPQHGIKKSHGRKKSCICVDRHDVIEKVRVRRVSG